MSHCPYCGDEVEIGLETCPHCGEGLRGQAPAGTPGRMKIAKPLHPFAVMGYIVLISGLIVFLQTWQKGPAKAKPGKSDEPVAAAPKPAPAAPAPKDEFRPETLNESDKKYMEIAKYEKSLAPVFAVVSEVDLVLSQQNLKLDGSVVQKLFQQLNDAKQKADTLQTPSGIGPCMSGVKTSVDQAKAALTAFWNYQSTQSNQHKDELQENLLGFRSQKNSCLTVIDNLKKELEPLLSHKKNILEKFSLSYNPNPGAPQSEQPPVQQQGATVQVPPVPAAPEPVPVPGTIKKSELREKKSSRPPGLEPLEPAPSPESPVNDEPPSAPMQFEDMQQEGNR